MIRKPLLVGLLLLTLLAMPLAVSARRLSAAASDRDGARARLVQARGDVQRVVELRSRSQRVAERKRPDQDVIARVNAVLRDAGLPEQRFRGVQQVGDEALPGQDDRRVVYRRQSVRINLQLTIPEFGRFLAQWSATQPLWTPARIELVAASSARGDARRAAATGRSTAVRRDHCSDHDLPWRGRPVTRMRSIWLGPAVLLFIFMLIGGCAASGPRGPYNATTPAQRETAKAEKITRQAVALIKTDPEKAEALLRDALTADLFYGPAHNNLGVIHLGRGELYEAAHEFEWARKLMPGVADPRMNLALALERAGRIDEAILAYEETLEVNREDVPTLQALCRLQLRYSRADADTDSRLEQIAMRGETEEWRAWAQRHMVMRREVVR